MAFAYPLATRLSARPAGGALRLRGWQWWLPLVLLLAGAFCLRDTGSVTVAEATATSAAPTGAGPLPVEGKTLLGALLVVGGLLAALPFVARRLTSATKGRGSIEIVESRPLAGRKALLIVEVDGRRMLLGSTEAGLSLLTELSAGKRPFAATLQAELGTALATPAVEPSA